ncbi:hypothetical protein FACS18948_5080 [Clostridia bacterium]|nr:hypothetical protein FACS18948_5080 [Clostridia bacterium]
MYIIFFYKHDPTDEKRYRYDRYTVYGHNRDKNLETHRHEVILYTGGTHGDGIESAELLEVLKYFNNPRSYEVAGTNVALIQQLDAAVDTVKDISEWREYIMTIQVKERQAELKGEARGEQRGKEIGKSEGIQIGKNEGIQIGKSEGIQIGKKDSALLMLRKFSAEVVADVLDLPISQVNMWAIESQSR